MMQTLQLQMAAQPKTSIALQIITLHNGQLQQLQKGDIVQVIVEQAPQNKLQASILGQQVNIEGLNKNMVGQQITLKVIKVGQNPQLELLNTGSSKLEKNTKGIFSTQIKSPAPSGLTHSKHAMIATAIQHKGNHTTILEVQLPTPHAGKATTEIIKIDSASRVIKLGENFKVRIDAQQRQILILQPEKNLTTTAKQLEKNPHSTLTKALKINTISSEAPLKVGKLINTMVQNRLPSGLISFQWQQHTFEAPAPTHVQTGDGLQLKVTQIGSHTEFDVVQHIPQGHKHAAQLFRQHIGQHEPQHKNLNTLLQAIKALPANPNHLNNLPPSHTTGTGPPLQLNPVELLSQWINNHALNSDKNIDGKTLANSLQQLGQNFEKSLLQPQPSSNIQHIKQNDLKAVLLQLINFINKQATNDEIQQLKPSAQQALSRIESLQALNLIANFQSEPVRFELPLSIQGQFIPAYLSIQQQQSTYKQQETLENNETKQSFHILFALSLKNLGDVRIDTRVDQHAVYALFYHNNNQAKTFIQTSLPRLQMQLQKLGFSELHLSTTMESRMPKEKKTEFSNLINPIPSSDGLLDIQA
ncbi:MAG: hypothetical protein R8K49_02825 [Mariprofundaceae bacterium]